MKAEFDILDGVLADVELAILDECDEPPARGNPWPSAAVEALRAAQIAEASWLCRAYRSRMHKSASRRR